jgi:DNA-binding SARP family transcriptional activator
MSTTCIHGHRADDPSPCPSCGAGADDGHEAPPTGSSETLQHSGGVTQDGEAAVDEGPLAARCPNCGSLTDTSSACSQCGYLFAVSDSVPLWEEQRWDVVVRPDRAYYDLVDPEGIDFPDSVYSRRIPLLGDYLRIGRRSASKGIVPEIDLSGPLEDLGVSHRHAVLMRQPSGEWALVDEGSTNGTFLDSDHDPIPLNQPVPLADGSQVHLGAWTSLTVERGEPPASAPSDDEAPSRDTRAVARGRLGMDIGLLGPLELGVAGEDRLIGAPKARAVLAVLALRIGASVSAGDLEWALWGDREPKTAGKALQGYISTIRRALPAGAIETTTHGYRLLGPRDTVDVFRFERRSARGRELLASGHPGSAVAEIGRALDLWRGDPLPDLADGPVGAPEVSRLLELRAAAEDDLVDGRLQLGDHLGVVADIAASVEDQPLRQRRWGQLMLALHRSGRQVEALRAFQRVRELLGEEYGVEPSADILELERAIVLDAPELRWSVPAQGVPPARIASH